MRYVLKTETGEVVSALEVLPDGNGRLTVTGSPAEPLEHSVEMQLAYWRQEYVDGRGWTLEENPS